MNAENVYTLTEIKDKVLAEINGITTEKDIIAHVSKCVLPTIEKMAVGKGKHVFLSSKYYSSSCDITDTEERKFLLRYNWGKLVILTIKRVSDTEYYLSYGISV